MSETETTGATDSGSADTGSSSVPLAPDHAFREKAWDAIQRDTTTESAADYVAEKKDREAEQRGDPELHNPYRKQERLDRWKRALDVASETTKADAPEHTVAEASQSVETGESQEQIVRRAKLEGQFEVRAKEFGKSEPMFEKALTEAFQVFPASPHLAESILESPVGPELAFMLAQEPMAINELNALPPAVAARYIGAIEGKLLAERAQSQVSAQPERRQTRAPAPLKPLSGGAASPTKDPRNMSTTEYVAWRKSGGGGRPAF